MKGIIFTYQHEIAAALEATGSFDQINVPYKKLCGIVKGDTVRGKMISFLKSAAAVSRLKGLIFGNFGIEATVFAQ